MTEKEKMLAGEWFHPNDAELEQDRTRARHLTHRLNVTLKDKDATYLATLRELCPGVEAMIRAPFYCDYGYNISTSLPSRLGLWSLRLRRTASRSGSTRSTRLWPHRPSGASKISSNAPS